MGLWLEVLLLLFLAFACVSLHNIRNIIVLLFIVIFLREVFFLIHLIYNIWIFIIILITFFIEFLLSLLNQFVNLRLLLILVKLIAISHMNIRSPASSALSWAYQLVILVLKVLSFLFDVRDISLFFKICFWRWTCTRYWNLLFLGTALWVDSLFCFLYTFSLLLKIEFIIFRYIW